MISTSKTASDRLRRVAGAALAVLRLKAPLLRVYRWRQERKSIKRFPITKPIDRMSVEILSNPEFQHSVNEVANLTLLDTPRLANLWQLCRATDHSGAMLEVGSFRGGGALHLSNACPQRTIIACDSFQSFETIDPVLDYQFHKDQFANTEYEKVANLFSSRGRTGRVFSGFFPASVTGGKLPRISFVHLDVDTYKATAESLGYLLESELMLPRSLIVVDDFLRGTGVDQAVAKVLAEHADWRSFPLFPAQGLLVPRSYLEAAT